MNAEGMTNSYPSLRRSSVNDADALSVQVNAAEVCEVKVNFLQQDILLSFQLDNQLAKHLKNSTLLSPTMMALPRKLGV